MSYLLDKRIRRNKFWKYIISILVLFLLFYFRYSIWSGLSSAALTVSRPVWTLGNGIKDFVSNGGSYFYSKKALELENQELKSKLAEEDVKMLNYNSLLDENLKLKEILNRKVEKAELILSAVLSKPNQSPYDTLIIDSGSADGLSVGQKVFALGNIPIGRIAEVYTKSSKVILFSSPGEKTEVIISSAHNSITEVSKDTFMQIVGRGGGNFEMTLPRDFSLDMGTEAVLPGNNAYTVAVVESVISDPRDAFQKVLLSGPVNIQELKFVEVEK